MSYPQKHARTLNSKDQDSLADHMTKMKREAKEREIEREVQGFRECLHPAKTNLLQYISAILMGKCQFNIHVQETPRASLAPTESKSFFHWHSLSAPSPSFYPVDNTVDQSFTDGFSRSLCRAFRATGVLTLKLTVSKSSLITLSFTPTCSLCSRLTALATRVRLVPACYGITQ